ncbi:MAG: hypothetical protein NVS1B12_17430 [Acidimicrobiales bacterium]
MPTTENDHAALDAAILDAISASVSAVGRTAPVADRLQRLVDLARAIGGARYAALGVAGPEGDFSHFVVSGMDDDLIARIGPLPRTHGLLAIVLAHGVTIRSDDIGTDPRFGWWPDAHPAMKAFIGVPVRAGGDVVAAYYLADRDGAGGFVADEVERVERLASRTGVAVELSRLWDERLELAVLDDRSRLAAELHDSVSQTLFSMGLLAAAASEALGDDPVTTRDLLEQIRDLAGSAVAELRSIIFELRPPVLEEVGLAAVLTQHVDVLRRIHRGEIELEVDGARRLRPRIEREVLRIAQEALGNAVRHAHATTIWVELTFGADALHLRVRDDGLGFEPTPTGGHLGLITMEERARAVGGRLTVTSGNDGTNVDVEVPVGG